MQFVSGPVLGMLSDRFGRRPVMLISILGLSLDFLVMAFAPTLAWLLLGRVLNGATAASFSTANAYVADIATPADARPQLRLDGLGLQRRLPARARRSAASWRRMPIHIGGFVLDGIRMPFVVAAGLCAVNWIYGLLVLPESLPPERRDRGVRLAARQPGGQPVAAALAPATCCRWPRSTSWSSWPSRCCPASSCSTPSCATTGR